MNKVYINSVGTSVPRLSLKQSEVCRLMDIHYKDEISERAMDVLHKSISHPSISKRHFAVESSDGPLTFKNEDPDKRIDRFTRWSVKLSKEAALEAMKRAGVEPGDITAIVVNTCTGYICPGISTYLIDELGLSRDIQAHDLVGSGCAGAVPNIYTGSRLISDEDNGVALCISTEICSATFEMGNDLSLIISNAIFGDGSAAAVVSRRKKGFALSNVKSRFNADFREDVRYIYKRGRLHNQITSKLPSVIGKLVPEFISELIESQKITKDDVKFWALHPGGAKMMDLLQEKLGLSDEQMQTTRDIYSDYGNMSSATVLFELERIIRSRPRKGDRCLMTAYGAGLSIHGCLLQWEDA